MQLKISFKHLEHTPAIDEKIKAKSEKLKKFFNGNFEVQWFCYAKDQDHCADVKILGPQFEYHASGKSDNLYKCLDLAIGKIETQLKKKKSKWKQNINQKHQLVVKNGPIDEMIKDENKAWDEKEEEAA
jgi:putative sigma-54 modulation protein